MLKIRIETDMDGNIEREVNLDKEMVTWVDIAEEFGNALCGLGYKLPADWGEYLEGKMNEIDDIYDECECDECDHGGDCHRCNHGGDYRCGEAQMWGTEE